MIKIMKFTFLQHVTTRSYKSSTFIIAALIIALGIGGFILADNLIETDEPNDITKVFVCDTSVTQGIPYDLLHRSGKEYYKNIAFETSDLTVAETLEKAAAEGPKTCVLEVKNEENDENSFKIRVIKPEGFEAEEKSASNLAEFVKDNFKYILCEKADLSPEQQAEFFMNTKVEMKVAGEEESSFADDMIKNIIPVLLGVVLYMMLCIYGQGVARCIVIEKDSKMMESLLVMTKPYDLIFGKILGMYFAALLQFFVWVASIFIGISAGMSVSSDVGEKFKEFLGMLSGQGGFSVPAFVIGFIAILVGFLLYISLAAFTGSFASKTEEISNYFGIYTMIVVVSWIFPYTNQLSGNDHMLKILRFVPFTSPFTVPADIVIGNIDMMTAVISTALMIAATVVVVYLTARVYKALVLYRGEPVKIKDVLRMLKKKNA